MTDRICRGYGCNGRAEFLIEPVGEYDSMGWEQVAVCGTHLDTNVKTYLDELDAVQVSFAGVGSTTEER